jgi:hypothetical protein
MHRICTVIFFEEETWGMGIQVIVIGFQKLRWKQFRIQLIFQMTENRLVGSAPFIPETFRV